MTITAKSYKRSKPNDPVKTKNDDDESCAAPNAITMKKTIAAHFNLLFIITIWGLPGNTIAQGYYAWAYIFQSILTSTGWAMTPDRIVWADWLNFLGLTKWG